MDIVKNDTYSFRKIELDAPAVEKIGSQFI